MNWRDEPVKVGDQFLTEKGGVVTVRRAPSEKIEANADGELIGVWASDFTPLACGTFTAKHYGPIIDKINKEKTMCDKQEWKTGPCTLTSKDGKSVLVGVCGGANGSDAFSFRIAGATGTNVFVKSDWTPTYPLPALPDKVGSVIESGDGVRFMRFREGGYAWVSPKEEVFGSTANIHDDRHVTEHCASHGGFKILLEGK